MSTHEITSEKIAQKLSQIWASHKADSFKSYLNEISGRMPKDPVEFDCVFIGEVETGNVDTSIMEGSEQWWCVDNNGFRKSNPPGQSLFDRDYQEMVSGQLKRVARLRFLVDNKRILIEELYGASAMVRKVADLAVRNDEIVFENVKIVWKAWP